MRPKIYCAHIRKKTLYMPNTDYVFSGDLCYSDNDEEFKIYCVSELYDAYDFTDVDMTPEIEKKIIDSVDFTDFKQE